MKDWHKKACEMSNQGLDSISIGRKLGKSSSTVRWAISEDQKNKSYARVRRKRARQSYEAGIITYREMVDRMNKQRPSP